MCAILIFLSQKEYNRARNLRCAMAYVCETVFNLKKVMVGMIGNGEVRE